MTTPLVIGTVVTAFTSAQTEHGGHESTISRPANTRRRRSVIVLPSGTSFRYTVHEVFDGHENPNDTLLNRPPGESPDKTPLVVPRAQVLPSRGSRESSEPRDRQAS
jgi:hypothetical protein